MNLPKYCVICAQETVHRALYCNDCKRKRLNAKLASKRAEMPLMYSAYAIVREAVVAGILPKARGLKCVDCGQEAWHYDHRDYRKPLEIEPVCISCNYRRGRAEPYKATGVSQAIILGLE